MVDKLQVSFIKFFSMKKFIINIIAFIAIVAVVAIFFDYAITTGLYKRTDYQQEVWNDLMDSTINPDVIVLGNCVALHDVDPAIIDTMLGVDSYVFAMSNLTFPYHFFMWDMYKKYKQTLPELVILCLDYSDMNFREAKTNEENEQFLSLMYDKDARDFLLQYGGYNFLDAYFPCYRYFGHAKRIKYGLMNFMGVNKYVGTRDRYKGYQALDVPYSFPKDWFDGTFTQPIEEDVVAMLDTFLNDCNEMGVEVLVTLPPIAYELSDLIENKEDVYEIYESMSKKYGFPCLNYCAPHWMSMDTNYFETPNHLNYYIADQYTIDLVRYIKETCMLDNNK